MMRASERLRAQNSLCKKVRVCIRTGMFNPEEAKYTNGVVVDMPYPTDDVRLLTQAAVGALDRIFRPGFKYSKAEVMLLSLCQPGEYTDDLFAISQPMEATRVMTVMDQINKGTMRSASVPINPLWAMRREMMSRSYTTKLDQLWTVMCN
jgi:DNA polymerase V